MTPRGARHAYLPALGARPYRSHSRPHGRERRACGSLSPGRAHALWIHHLVLCCGAAPFPGRVPIDMGPLAQLARSPRRMDLYAWLSYRTPRSGPIQRSLSPQGRDHEMLTLPAKVVSLGEAGGAIWSPGAGQAIVRCPRSRPPRSPVGYSGIRPSSRTLAATRSSIVHSLRASALSSCASEAGVWTTIGSLP